MSSQRHLSAMSLPVKGKPSLSFENIVCTQLELQRRATSFTHRRSTMCRHASQYRLSLTSNNAAAQFVTVQPSNLSVLSREFKRTNAANKKVF